MKSAEAFSLGLRSVMPILVGVAPFGVIYGVVALQSGIAPLAAMAMSSIVFAGSAQFLLAQLVGAGAPFLLTAGAVGLVNLRHALYSASVAPILAHLPRRWKILLAYLLTDEAYAAAIPHLMAARPNSLQSANAHWILLGSGFGLWAGWQLATLAGVLIGTRLPADIGLDFALPLTFIAIVVPMIASRALLLAALAAGAVAVALAALPYKTGLFIAALAGIVVGAAMPRESK
jgi:4-azaleucine resistance transporter AzlC